MAMTIQVKYIYSIRHTHIKTISIRVYMFNYNAAKFNAYCGLNMSGCHLLPEELSPSVCIVDDYEAIRPHYMVNHVTENKVNYIALPNEDYILTDEQTEYDIDGNKAIRKIDGIEFTIHSGIKKNIDSKYYDEIEGSPALNSFDGQGLMSPEWAERVARHLRIGHTPAELIVRAAWVKGLLVTMPFKEWFEEHGITEITDSFGKVRQIADIDCIISKSQFKMHKIYKAKCSTLGVNAWDYHQKAMKENHLLWGITRINSRTDDDVKTLNYQYIQAFQLENDDIDALCGQTEALLRKLNSGDIEEVYKNLVIGGKGLRLNEHYEVTDDSDDAGKKLFQKVIESNPDFINDKYIRSLIFKECETKFNGAKLGKILVNGNFQFCASDPIAQIEWIAKNHCGLDIEVKGIVPAGHIYSNYWLNREEKTDEIVLMRSPLIDRNEIAKRQLVKEQENYFRYLVSGLVCSIYDLGALQEGGCDFDGDILFSTNNDIIGNACYDFATAKPLYYELSTTNLVGMITPANLIQADIRGLNSAVGQISNKAGSLYAMLENYAENSPEYAKIYESIVALGQIVGMEIDRIKTAVAPTFPLEWSTLQTCKVQTRDMVEVDISDDEEQEGVFRHNNVVPDVKPYFFRYNYEYLNESINTLDRVFNEVSKPTFGKKWEEVKELCRNGKGNERMNQLYQQYHEAYPVIDTDCIVNHISHRFEKLERDIYRQTLAEGEKMLKSYIGNTPMQDDILSKVNQFVVAYQRFRCFSAKPIRTKESNKSKSVKANNIRQRVRQY